MFESVRVDVDVDREVDGNISGGGEGQGREYVRAWQTFCGNEWGNKGEERGKGEASTVGGIAKAEVEVRVVGGKDFYAKRQGCKFIPINHPTLLNS